MANLYLGRQCGNNLDTIRKNQDLYTRNCTDSADWYKTPFKLRCS
jgi:hypothetical protein